MHEKEGKKEVTERLRVNGWPQKGKNGLVSDAKEYSKRADC